MNDLAKLSELTMQNVSGLNPIGDIAFSDIRYAQLFKCFLKTYNIKNGMYQFTLQKSIQNKISLYKTNSKFK
jgi:hypothetical protein